MTLQQENVMKAQIIMPSEILVTLDISEAILPGTKGDFGVKLGHMNLASNVQQGIITLLSTTGKIAKYFVSNAIIKVEHEKLTILTEFAYEISKLRRNEIDNKIRIFHKNRKQFENDSIEHRILDQKIKQFETLKEYIK